MLNLLAPNDLGGGGLAVHLPDDRPVRLPVAAEVLARVAAGASVITEPVPQPAADAIPTPTPVPIADLADDPLRDPVVAAPAGSADARPFRKGDLVVYPAHGIGTVDQVRVEEIAGQKLNWIKISFAENRMCLRVPVRKAQDIGLRRPVSRHAFAEVLTIIRGRPHANRLVWTKRALEYQGKINSGCVKALAEVVRDLRPALDGSESSFSRRNLYESAVDRLAGEFAAVFRTDKAAAVGRLTATSAG
ncbi:MAG TPA: CarD family transcriptional regulator [Acetobacteraceae bacterium]|nr:CarD family transcriptional regulator [Acetobacteraceae bacterium]